MPDNLEAVLELTGILQEYRNIYIAATFAILGFLIQRKGYRTKGERLIVCAAFLAFALGNLYQTWQTAKNIEILLKNSTEFQYVTPDQILVSHLLIDIAVLVVLLRVFRISNERELAQRSKSSNIEKLD